MKKENGTIEEPIQLTPPRRKAAELKTVSQLVDLPEFREEVCEISIVGKTPLIVHNWSHKAIKMMLDKQTGEATKGREKKQPFEDFKGSLYPVMVDGQQMYGVPAPAFKASAVSAANSVQLKMTQMRQAFHVASYTVPIFGDPITAPMTEWDEKYSKELQSYHALGISMRMDVVRLETGVADLRFRAWWPTWRTKLTVEYNPSMISLPQLLNLFRSGGSGCGICEWRPSAPKCRSGEFGRFALA